MSAPELTPEELNYYASLDLADPDEDVLQRFLHASPTSSTARGGPAAVAVVDAAESPTHSKALTSSSTSSSSAVAVSTGAVARRRLSTSASLGTVGSSAAGRAAAFLRGGCCDITDVLEKPDLVGGVAGMADAALHTRVLELPGRALTSLSAILCFLNATHLYLQHNEISSLDGLELLRQLQVLVIHRNALTSVEPLHQLERLFFLDLSFNRLASLATLLEKELPCAALQSLNLRGNPCHQSSRNATVVAGCGATESVENNSYVSTVRAAYPKLEYLDDVRLVSDADDAIQDAVSMEVTADAEEKEGPDVSTTVRNGSIRGSRGNGGSGSSRRVHELVEAARAAANTECGTRGSAAAVDDDGGDARPASGPSAATTSKHPTQLEHEEERLLRQLRQLRTSDPSDAASHTNNSDDDDADAATETARQLFQDLQYTQEVSQARQRRSVAAYWDDMNRVLQTAQGLQQDRRRRMQERLQADTPSYAETLQLLQRESYTKDLSRYRNTEPPIPATSPPQQLPVSVSAASASPPVRRGAETGTVAATKTTSMKAQKNSLPKKNETGPTRTPRPPPSRR